MTPLQDCTFFCVAQFFMAVNFTIVHRLSDCTGYFLTSVAPDVYPRLALQRYVVQSGIHRASGDHLGGAAAGEAGAIAREGKLPLRFSNSHRRT